MSVQSAVCEICHGRPKMDRSSCCEECWYSGRYSAAMEDQRLRRENRHLWEFERQQRVLRWYRS